MLDTGENRRRIIQAFPNLAYDELFKIVGPPNPNYNCIAWVGFRQDVWWWPLPLDKRPQQFDGVTYDWPYELMHDEGVLTFIELYTRLGYLKCDDGNFEKNYRKIAIYSINDKVTHASRQITSNDPPVWSSKLGRGFLIHHGSPEAIECDSYGIVAQFMKKKTR